LCYLQTVALLLRYLGRTDRRAQKAFLLTISVEVVVCSSGYSNVGVSGRSGFWIITMMWPHTLFSGRLMVSLFYLLLDEALIFGEGRHGHTAWRWAHSNFGR